MSAIVMRIRAFLGSVGNGKAKYSKAPSREELAAFDSRQILLSGRGIGGLRPGFNGSQRKHPRN